MYKHTTWNIYIQSMLKNPHSDQYKFKHIALKCSEWESNSMQLSCLDSINKTITQQKPESKNHLSPTGADLASQRPSHYPSNFHERPNPPAPLWTSNMWVHIERFYCRIPGIFMSSWMADMKGLILTQKKPIILMFVEGTEPFQNKTPRKGYSLIVKELKQELCPINTILKIHYRSSKRPKVVNHKKEVPPKKKKHSEETCNM